MSKFAVAPSANLIEPSPSGVFVSKPCRVVIADDHAIVRNAVRPLLQALPGVEIVGEADNGLAAIALIKSLRPDLLVLDVSMPHAGGIAVLVEVRRWSPATRILVFTGNTNSATLGQLIANGAIGILLKSNTPEELALGFKKVVLGESYIAAEARTALETGSALAQLTQRESQILSLAVQGKSNVEIAALLHISHKTADNHRTNLMRKLQVHSIAELTALAAREGLLQS